MLIVHLIPEYRGATQSCKLLLYWSCDLTQWGPLPPFSLTFGFSSLAAEGGHHNLGLSWVALASIHMVKNLLWLIVLLDGQKKSYPAVIIIYQLCFCFYVSGVQWKKKRKKRNSVPTPTLCPEGLFITIKTELFSTLFLLTERPADQWKLSSLLFAHRDSKPLETKFCPFFFSCAYCKLKQPQRQPGTWFNSNTLKNKD